MRLVQPPRRDFLRRRSFRAARRITGWMKAAVRREPDILWQFVFAPRREEPLDLL